MGEVTSTKRSESDLLERDASAERLTVPPLPAEDPFIGKTLDNRYRIQATIARGGMGTVYRAEQVQLGRPVAIKILHTSSAGPSKSFHERFYREATACARLRSRHTVVIHDYGRTEDGTYFIAMELLEGQTLLEFVNEHGPLDGPTALQIASQVAKSLSEAHDQDLVHRDLKPSNVFVAESPSGRIVKVLDFGLVKRLGQSDATLTRSGTLVGSPKYMSPEQVIGVHIDARSDIYSLGAVLYRMVTGRPPFEDASDFELMASHVHNPPPALREAHPGCEVSEELEAVILRCLAKDKSERVASMKALLVALSECPEAAGVPRKTWTIPPPSANESTPPPISVPRGDASAEALDRHSAEITAARRRPASDETASSKGPKLMALAALVAVGLGAAVLALTLGDDDGVTDSEIAPATTAEAPPVEDVAATERTPAPPPRNPSPSAPDDEADPPAESEISAESAETSRSSGADATRASMGRSRPRARERRETNPVDEEQGATEESPMRRALTDNRDPWAG